MKLKEAYTFFEGLRSLTTKTSEIKIYDKFLLIITGLKSKELSLDQIQSIESKIDSLNLDSNSGNRKKYYKKALGQFEEYLKDTFSLTSRGYYTNLGIALGSCFGMMFGTAVLSSFERSGGISLGLFIGIIIGLAIGRSMDLKAMDEGRVL